METIHRFERAESDLAEFAARVSEERHGELLLTLATHRGACLLGYPGAPEQSRETLRATLQAATFGAQLERALEDLVRHAEESLAVLQRPPLGGSEPVDEAVRALLAARDQLAFARVACEERGRPWTNATAAAVDSLDDGLRRCLPELVRHNEQRRPLARRLAKAEQGARLSRRLWWWTERIECDSTHITGVVRGEHARGAHVIACSQCQQSIGELALGAAILESTAEATPKYRHARHLSLTALVGYASGQLPSSERTSVEGHLEICRRCREEVEAIEDGLTHTTVRSVSGTVYGHVSRIVPLGIPGGLQRVRLTGQEPPSVSEARVLCADSVEPADPTDGAQVLADVHGPPMLRVRAVEAWPVPPVRAAEEFDGERFESHLVISVIRGDFPQDDEPFPSLEKDEAVRVFDSRGQDAVKEVLFADARRRTVAVSGRDGERYQVRGPTGELLVELICGRKGVRR